MMTAAHPIACRCGQFQAELQRTAPVTRVTCYCRDCRCFALFLEAGAAVLDPQGGTDIVVTDPRFVRFVRGIDQLACMSLSPAGTLRWFARCCSTPVGNVARDRRIAHVGLIHTALERSPAAMDSAFGPVRLVVSAGSAKGRPARVHRIAAGVALAGHLGRMMWSRVTGRYRESPFFDPQSGQALVAPRVLTKDERDQLRRMA